MMRGVCFHPREASPRAGARRGSRGRREAVAPLQFPARQLPDKSVSLLDTACARVAISQHATPPEVEDCRRRIEALTVELEIISREEAVGVDIGERKTHAQTLMDHRKGEARRPGVTLEQRERSSSTRSSSCAPSFASARDKVEGTSSDLEAKAETAAAPDPERLAALEQLKMLQVDLHKLQGDAPLILPSVDEQAVASVVGDWTGIPVGRMVKNEIETVLNLAKTLEPARDRSVACHGDDHHAHQDLARGLGEPPTSPSACSCSPAPRA